MGGDQTSMPADHGGAVEANERDENGCTRAEAQHWRACHTMLWGLIEDAIRSAPNTSEARRRAALLRCELLELHNKL